jgi:hypothetical protein
LKQKIKRHKKKPQNKEMKHKQVQKISKIEAKHKNKEPQNTRSMKA